MADPPNNVTVLEIRRVQDRLTFLLKHRNIEVPGELILDPGLIEIISRNIDLTMQGSGATRQGRLEIEFPNRADLGDTYTFSKIAAEILPNSIQDEIKKMAGKSERLVIHTDQLALPWEMLELVEFLCPHCGRHTQPATCIKCKRVIYPGRLNDCSCGQYSKPILEAWRPSCQDTYPYNALIIKPVVHIGLGFGIERLPLDYQLPELASIETIEPRSLSILFIENPGGLNYSGRELADIRTFLEKNDRVVRAHILDKENANKQAIRRSLEKAGPFDIVHFAGHGIFVKDDPQQSYLSLAGDEKLGLSDIQPLFEGYYPQLVILNGCQTGVVVPQRDRQVGFPISFLNAGTRSVIGTLSPVADQQACYLTLYLYHELLQGVPLQEALLQAKRRMTRKEFKPEDGKTDFTTREVGFMYSWSSYVIYGDGDLRPRHFPPEITWHKLAVSAYHHLQSSIDDPHTLSKIELNEKTKTIELLEEFIRSDRGKIYVTSAASKNSLASTAYNLSELGQHIIGWVDLDTLPAEFKLTEWISRKILGQEKSLEEVLPFIEQMVTSESTFLIFMSGLSRQLSPIKPLSQMLELTQRSRGVIRFIVDGEPELWARLWSLHSGSLRPIIYNQADLARMTAGVLMGRLYKWADKLSADQLGVIPNDKWDPDRTDLYIPRKIIEAKVDEFIRRDQMTSRGFCVLGETGRGKTNLLCRLYKKYAKQLPAGHLRITVFTTASGLVELAHDPNGLRRYMEGILIQIFTGQHPSVNPHDPVAIQSALDILQRESGGRSVEILLLIDAVNEFEGGAHQLVEGLKDLLDAFRSFDSKGFYLSMIVSSRTFSWRSLWAGREIEHRSYFPNLNLETGQIEENLLDFDLSNEAREAYERAGLQPPWANLTDELRGLFRTPFFLQIVRAISRAGGEKGIPSSYYEVMKYYEDIVLMRKGGSWSGVKKSELRETVLDAMVLGMIDEERIDGSKSPLPQEMRHKELCERIRNYLPEEVDVAIRELCDENVLETRGSQLRFAFDLFFDYRFRNYLIQHFGTVGESEGEWHRIIEKYCYSEYHRHGVSSALAEEVSHFTNSEKTVQLLISFLEPHQNQSPPPSYRQLVRDSMIIFGEERPIRFAEVLSLLYLRTRSAETVAEWACAVLGSPKASRADKQDLIGVLIQVLQDYLTGSRQARDRKMRRNLINLVGGLGREENGIELIIDIVAAILGVDLFTQRPSEAFGIVLEFFVDPHIQNALSRIRNRALPLFRDPDGRIRMILKILLAALGTPTSTGTLLFQSRYLKLLGTIGDTLRRIELGLEIIIKGIFLWFSEQRGSAEEKFHQSMKIVDTLLGGSLLAPLTFLFRNPSTSQAFKDEVIGNISFYVGLVGIWPEVKRLFSYSEQGLDKLSLVLDEKGKGADLADLLRLLDIQTPMSTIPQAQDRLYQLFLEPDAFQNYLGMLSTIVQGTADFSQVEDMLWSLFTEEYDGQFIEYQRQRIPQRVKISREVFSIFSYMIRRTAQVNRAQLNQQIDFLRKVVANFFTFETNSPEPPDLIRYFLRMELFGHEDPFNPLLALGVAAQHAADPRLVLPPHQNFALYLIDRFQETRWKERYLLISRVLHELVPMSYFAPLVVIGTLEDFIKNRRFLVESQPAVRSALVDVIKSLDQVIGDQVEKLFGYLNLYAQVLLGENHRSGKEFSAYIDRLQNDVLGKSLGPAEVEYLYRSIDVFGGHDLVTTLFIEYHNVRKLLVPHIIENIQKVNTASELVFGVANTLIGLLASPEINFSITRLVFQSLDIRKEEL
ncbi:MAG: CHAT domain-containing protein [Chloroflexi bacterium]|nr:CHAT domain-containing protein [Chloroflexota bacterium]